MELDSLELKVSAEAQSAEKALDNLIGKLQSFSKALGGINTTSISKNLENLAKVGGLKTVTKEVEDLGKTVDNVGKKKTKTEVKVDVKQGLEAIKELQSKFSNIGKVRPKKIAEYVHTRCCKQVDMYNGTVKVQRFASVLDAAKFIGKPNAQVNISACALGKRKSAYGYGWVYID